MASQSFEYFTIQGVENSNAITLKPLGTFSAENSNKIRDTIVNRFLIDDSLVGEVVACNISPYYLVTKKRLPIVYVNIWNITQVMKNNVMKLFLYIDLPSLIDTREDIYTKVFKGKFRWTKMLDKEETDFDLIKFKKYPGNKQLLKIIEKVTKNELLDESKKIAKELTEEFQKQLGMNYSSTEPEVTLSLPKNEQGLEKEALEELKNELSPEEYEELLKELENE